MRQKSSVAGIGRALALAIVLLWAGTGLARADDITYDIAQTVGGGQMTGTIETDGTQGFLTYGNILDWNLTLSDAGGSMDLTGPLSGNNSKFYLAPSTLETIGDVFIINIEDPQQAEFGFYNGSFTTEYGDVGVYQFLYVNGDYYSVPTDLITLGTVAPTITPEPGTIGLMLIGLASMVLVRKRIPLCHLQAI